MGHLYPRLPIVRRLHICNAAEGRYEFGSIAGAALEVTVAPEMAALPGEHVSVETIF